jgi:hypothetical protein
VLHQARPSGWTRRVVGSRRVLACEPKRLVGSRGLIPVGLTLSGPLAYRCEACCIGRFRLPVTHPSHVVVRDGETARSALSADMAGRGRPMHVTHQTPGPSLTHRLKEILS